MIDGAPERYQTGVGSAKPALSYLYDVRDCDKVEVSKLSEEIKGEYHNLTAQCLYLSKRDRPDLQISIAFRCIRVLSLDEGGDLKLARTIRYLMATRHLPLILKIDDNEIIEWWVDASFVVHEDMRSRTEMYMSVNKVTIYGAFLIQKITTISSTEAELVRVADAMPKILRCKYFMEGQRYLVENIYVYQDNISAILLGKNGMKSVVKAHNM